MSETCRVSWQNKILDTWCVLLVIYTKINLFLCFDVTNSLLKSVPGIFDTLHGWQIIGRLYCKISLRLLQSRGQGHYRLSCVGHWAGQITDGGWSCVRASLILVTQMAPYKTQRELKGQFSFTVWKTSYPWNRRLQNYTLLLQEFILNRGWRYGWPIWTWRWNYVGIRLWNNKGTKKFIRPLNYMALRFIKY
jgi:hypothetical protein